MAQSSLPDLVLATILNYTDTSDSKSLLACCKGLRDLTLAHKPIALIAPLQGCHSTSSPGSPPASRARQRGRMVTSEQLQRLQRVSAQCPTLARLKLVCLERHREHMDEQLSAVFETCMVQLGGAAAQTLLMNITHVTLQNMSITTFLPLQYKWVPNLEHLVLKEVDIQPHVDSHTLPTPIFPHLRDITVDCSCEVHSLPLTPQHIKQQLRSLPSLNSLHIYQGFEWGMTCHLRSSITDGIEVVASQLTSLTCNDSTPPSHLLAAPFPWLQCLTMLTKRVEDVEMESLLTHLPVLQQLSVHSFSFTKDYSGRVCTWSQLEIMQLEVSQLLQLPLARVRQLQVRRRVMAWAPPGRTVQLQLQQAAAALQVAEACGGLQPSAAPCTLSCAAVEQQQGMVRFVAGGDKDVLIATVPLLAHFHALHLFADALSLDLLKAIGQLHRCTYLNVHVCGYLRSQAEQVDHLVQQMLDCLPHVQVLEGAETLCTQVHQFEALLKSVMRPITLRFQVAELDRLYVEDGHAGDGFNERALDDFIHQHTPHPECIRYVLE